MRVLLTGMGGFVALHLANELKAHGHEVWGTDIHAGTRQPLAGHGILRADLRRKDEVQAVFEVAQPEAVVHLGAQSNPTKSWEIPKETFDINVTGTRHIVECAGALEQPARVVVASTSDVYGQPQPEFLPISESSPLDPLTPYAVSKIAAENIARVYGRRLGVPVVVVRPFSQIGPGQLMQFAASNFAHEIARIEAGGGDVLRHGDLGAGRDFTDVRDMARAYRLLLESDIDHGTWNIASGKSTRIGEVLEGLLALSSATVRCEPDPTLLRGGEPAERRGDSAAFREATGWEPRVPLEQSLRDLLEEHREYFRIAAEQEAIEQSED